MKFNSAKVHVFTLSLSLVAGLGLVLFFCVFKSQPITFKSLESKRDDGGAVFNRVTLLKQDDQDVWLMQQSHQGLDDNYTSWDRLAIVVDKSQKPFRASFYQLSPGEISAPINWQPAPLKAACFACHPNGPRAIRPDHQRYQVSMADRLRLWFWNLRIKSYGPVQSIVGFEVEGSVAFQAESSAVQRALPLASCSWCHRQGGLRSELQWQHLLTAQYLIEAGAMPPFPFRISRRDKELIDGLIDIR